MATWRTVPGLPDYDVSSDGGGRSRRGWGGRSSIAPKPLFPVRNHDGYLVVSLVGPHGRRQYFVHRLVAMAFLGPIPEGHVVAHGNGVRHDARLNNLRFATPAENEADKVRHGTHLAAERHPNAVLSDAQVVAIRDEYLAGHVTQAVLAAKYGTHQTNVSLIVRGLTRSKKAVA